MEDIQSFIQELQDNTLSNIDIRKQREENKRKEQYKKLEECISTLEQNIKQNCKELMKQSSDEGHYYATLLQFTNQDTLDDYKTVFLVKGPLNGTRASGGLAYFERRGIVPLLQRIAEHLSPLPVFIKYDRHRKTHSIIVSWKYT